MRIIKQVQRLLKEKNCSFAYDPNLMAFDASFPIKNTLLSIIIQIDNKRRLLVCDVLCPLIILPHRKSAFSKLVMRVNKSFEFGRWILHDSCILTSRVIVNINRADIDDKFLEIAIFNNACLMDWLIPAISTLLYTECTPSEALAVLIEDKDVDQDTNPTSRFDFDYYSEN